MKCEKTIQERSFDFAVRVVKLCQFLDEKPGTSRMLAKQLVRSGTSIGANMEEAVAAQSEADYLTKCSIACKEARETLYWLKLLVASEIISEEKINELMKESNRIVGILTTTCKKLKERKNVQ